jgi:NAD(P)-dependent dehydrogenase (short-subunit alcohol dehydrogenase family)
MKLDGKTILVTGSTHGIGEAIARRLHQDGAKVMIHGRDEAAARAVVESLGERSAFVIADITDPLACEKVVDATVAQFGGIDGLVNNAGISPRSNIDTSSAELFDSLMALNLRAPLLITRHAVKYFRNNPNKGSVVNIGSINAHGGESVLLIYSMSKGGLMTMTRNLGHSLSTEGIRVNQLNVGWTVTPNEHQLQLKQGHGEAWQSKISPLFAPRGELLTPQEVAAHVSFWISDQSAPVTGAVYEVEQYSVTGRNPIPEVMSGNI